MRKVRRVSKKKILVTDKYNRNRDDEIIEIYRNEYNIEPFIIYSRKHEDCWDDELEYMVRMKWTG